MCQQIRLLLHIQHTEMTNIGQLGIEIGTTPAIASADEQKQSAQPGFKSLLILPNMGQFMNHPYLIGRGSKGEVVRAVITREIDVPIGRNGNLHGRQTRNAAIDFDAGVINAVGKNQLCHFDFIVRQPASAFAHILSLFLS